MIELAIRPLHRVMALLAGGREARVRYRTGRAGEIFLMARNASRVCDVEVVVDVAIRAGAGRHGV